MREKHARERGQVSIEFVGVLPLILLVLVLLWQFVLVGYTFTLAGDAADRGARKATATNAWNRQAECEQTAVENLPAAWRTSAQINCSASNRPGVVAVTVNLKVPVLFPGGADFPMQITGKAGAAEEG